MTLVGVTCDEQQLTDRRGSAQSRFYVSSAYVRAIEKVGAACVLLPFHEENAERLLVRIDALVVSGGDFDVPPDYYGQAVDAKCGRLKPERSAFERTLLEAALARDMPVLGVCGGMQLLNVVCGGTLHQDLSLRPDTGVHEQTAPTVEASHALQVQPGSRLAALTGRTQLPANSTHHQIVDRLGTGLVPAATAEDGVVEAIEHERHRFAVGVQWHPEAMATAEQLAIYRGLVAAIA